ncbi:16S rRNA (cytidine(1402)-2'-O)-methyltransferase [Roseofilum casamattae]|uniref:Ribosomal RNA small subunit methyltransferase I n=1 Tax=Roseofilum casamattae BLCC-M143 TaxID=3022442 RepID=A0ABT7BSG5_9CYAN|nr:16S rRNA (cytidine(1402)-2'-O)-methyltransferase [Roseofilum casamattae]MDJ1182130.1 16S rRNA (cytidine(1402)-2'-O)-methyltransferase [Roseofilum casamattae BLCC-M143]
MNALGNGERGMLYVVGTPIGNLEDMTFRAVRILQSVDAIAAEDTRHTGKLLQHFQIETRQISCHEHNQQQRIPQLLALMKQGKAIALVSDAGLPGISDPGYEPIRATLDAGFTVVPIPGANAALTALSASGLASDRFCFEGFLPLKGKSRQQRLEHLKAETRTVILYEAPHRLLTTLQDLQLACSGDRAIAIGRELTKKYEEFWRGTINEARSHYQDYPPKGEFTLVLAGAEIDSREWSEAALKAELTELLQQGWSRSQASRHLAELIHLPKRKLYQIALQIPNFPNGSNVEHPKSRE